MKYAIANWYRPGGHMTLFETKDGPLGPDDKPVDAAYARAWVATGNHHMTALYVDVFDSGKVKYAKDPGP